MHWQALQIPTLMIMSIIERTYCFETFTTGIAGSLYGKGCTLHSLLELGGDDQCRSDDAAASSSKYGLPINAHAQSQFTSQLA